MKIAKIIGIVLLSIVVIISIFLSVYTANEENFNLNNDIQTGEVIPPSDSVIIVPTLDLEDITIWELQDDIADEDGEILIIANSETPYIEATDEFSQNLNEYYENVRLNAIDYLNYEGYDLAIQEKMVFKEQFTPLQYSGKFQITYRDENMISIMRTSTIVTNETEYTRVNCEILDTKDASLLLITDISSDFFEKLSENNEVNIDYLDYYLTDEGVYAIYEENTTFFEYKALELYEEFAYLGENNVAN